MIRQNPTGYAQVVDESQSGTVTRSYSYGLERISESQTISGTPTTSFYGYDGHGSVRQLTNSAGAVTDTYDYDAFGNLINSTGTTPNNYLFAGEQYDQGLSLYYNRARYLSVNLGRFITLDHDNGNIGDPRSLHLYLYADGDPVDEVDPTGKQTTTAEIGTELAVLLTVTVIVTTAVIANSHGQGKLEIPFRVNHYTQWAFLLSILANGLNQPKNYVTTDWYLWASEAKSKLALREKPQLLINFFVFKERDNLLGPNPVEPANDELGGGTEYSSDFPIPVSSRNPVVIPLFTN